MNTQIIGNLILQLVLIGLNAIFACTEIAVLSINENKLTKMAEEGNKKARPRKSWDRILPAVPPGLTRRA